MALPVVVGDNLIVRSADGFDIALNRDDGKQVWSVEHNIPALSVRGEGAPVAVGDMVIIGYFIAPQDLTIYRCHCVHTAFITTDKNDVITENWRSIKISQARFASAPLISARRVW
jgi:glucose dehydrogenase